MSDEINYAQILKALGSSRFSIGLLDGDEVEATLKGQLTKSKKKSDKIDLYDWVKIQKTDFEIKGSFYKIIERVGSEKDSEVKKLKKSGQLNKKVKKVDIKSEDTSDKVSFANDFKNEIDNNIEEIGDSWIDDI